MSNEVRACRHDLSSENISLLLSSIRLLASARNVETFKSILLQIKGVSTSFYSYLETNYLCERWVTTFSEVNRGHLSLSTQRLKRVCHYLQLKVTKRTAATPRSTATTTYLMVSLPMLLFIFPARSSRDLTVRQPTGLLHKERLDL